MQEYVCKFSVRPLTFRTSAFANFIFAILPSKNVVFYITEHNSKSFVGDNCYETVCSFYYFEKKNLCQMEISKGFLHVLEHCESTGFLSSRIWKACFIYVLEKVLDTGNVYEYHCITVTTVAK